MVFALFTLILLHVSWYDFHIYIYIYNIALLPYHNSNLSMLFFFGWLKSFGSTSQSILADLSYASDCFILQVYLFTLQSPPTRGINIIYKYSFTLLFFLCYLNFLPPGL